jgi:hypothetical protein
MTQPPQSGLVQWLLTGSKRAIHSYERLNIRSLDLAVLT